MNVYKTLPTFDGERFTLRGVLNTDGENLLKVYGDAKAAPYFNGDNCHGDDFHYATLERMNEAIKFWLWSYDNGYFVRWAVVDKTADAAVGTIELFHRDSANDVFDNCGLLRLDLRSDYEKSEYIAQILELIINPTYDLFYCDKIATKVKPFATERLSAVTSLGFTISNDPLVGNDGEHYFDYYVLKKKN